MIWHRLSQTVINAKAHGIALYHHGTDNAIQKTKHCGESQMQ